MACNAYKPFWEIFIGLGPDYSIKSIEIIDIIKLNVIACRMPDLRAQGIWKFLCCRGLRGRDPVRKSQCAGCCTFSPAKQWDSCGKRGDVQDLAQGIKPVCCRSPFSRGPEQL